MGAYDSNFPPACYPVRSVYQKDTAFGWIDRSGAVTRNPRGGAWTQIGDASPVGRRLFENVEFTTGDQGRSRGRRKEPYGS